MIDRAGFLAERKQAAHAGLAPGQIARPELDDLHAIARVTGLAVIRAASAICPLQDSCHHGVAHSA
jgi:hypothetical protein